MNLLESKNLDQKKFPEKCHVQKKRITNGVLSSRFSPEKFTSKRVLFN